MAFGVLLELPREPAVGADDHVIASFSEAADRTLISWISATLTGFDVSGLGRAGGSGPPRVPNASENQQRG
jgi:hypothetical protein